MDAYTDLYFLDYNKISDYINRAIEHYLKDIEEIRRYDYNKHYTYKQIIDMREKDEHLWFDEYFFFKYDGMISYASTFKGDKEHENSETFLILTATYNSTLANSEALCGDLPFSSMTVPLSYESDAFLFYLSEEIPLFNPSVNSFKRYILNDIPKLEKKCDFEFDLTRDEHSYDRLFMTLYILNDLSFIIDDMSGYDTCYTEEHHELLYGLTNYLKRKRDELINKLNNKEDVR